MALRCGPHDYLYEREIDWLCSILLRCSTSASRKLSSELMLSAKLRVVWVRLQYLFCQSCNNWTQPQHPYVAPSFIIHNTIWVVTYNRFQRLQRSCFATHVNWRIRFAMNSIVSESIFPVSRLPCFTEESQSKQTRTCYVTNNHTSSLEPPVESYNLQKRRT